MPPFNIGLPEGLILSVEVANSAIDFRIVFPVGKDVQFHFDPSKPPYSTVIPHAALKREIKDAALPANPGVETVCDGGPGGPVITYAADFANGSRPMDPQ